MYYYKQVKDGVITSVESKSVDTASPGFIKATKTEYDNFIASLPVIEPVLPRDLAAEVDVLKLRVGRLEKPK